MQEKLQKPRKNSVDIGKIMVLRKAGWSFNRIADDMGMSKQSVCNAVANLKKAHVAETGTDAGQKEQPKG